MCGAIWSTARSKTRIDGPRNSSTGVPITRITVSARAIIAADVLISRRPVARTRGSSSSAPFSRNGIWPPAMRSRAAPSMSKMPTRRPDFDEGEAQRQADVAGAPEDDDVERGGWLDRGAGWRPCLSCGAP